MKNAVRYLFTGLAAGTVTGVIGSGGGLVLVPLLSVFCQVDDAAVFGQSLSIMLPICICSLLVQHVYCAVPLQELMPYLFGGAVGGACAAVIGKHISSAWLHRIFGLIMLWSGIRCLFS